MKTLIHILFRRIAAALRERWYLQLEHLALLHQVEVLKRSAKRPRFDPADRCLWVLVSQWWPGWTQALEIMQADTVRRWRRQGMRHHVRWRRGRKRPGRPPIPAETRKLIRDMSRDNRLWGAPRIHGELAKLGITVSCTTVAKYMTRRPYPPSPTWRTFFRTHVPDLIGQEALMDAYQRLRALSLRLWCCLRRWFNRFVSGERPSEFRDDVVIWLPARQTVSRPVSLTPDTKKRAVMCGRSPPAAAWSSYAELVVATPQDEVKAEARFVPLAMGTCDAPTVRRRPMPRYIPSHSKGILQCIAA